MRDTFKVRTTESATLFTATSALVAVGSESSTALTVRYVVLHSLALFYILFSYDQAGVIHDILEEFKPTSFCTKVSYSYLTFNSVLECRDEVLAFLVESFVQPRPY